MSDILKLVADCFSFPEENIVVHAINRLRLGQPQPTYAIGDIDWTRMVRRCRAEHGFALGYANVDGSRVPYADLAIGQTTARVFAGGPKLLDGQIEVIEP